MPGVLRDRLRENDTLERVLAQSVLLYRRDRSREGASKHARLVSALLAKILQRGRIPLPSLGVEREALREHGLLEGARDLSSSGSEMGWELSGGATAGVTAESLLAALSKRCDFSLDPEYAADSGSPLQSPEEEWFLKTWVPTTLGPSAGHWFAPHTFVDTLLESGGELSGDEAPSGQRVDFLFHYPGSPMTTIGIEIDGGGELAAAVDDVRERALKKIGIQVFRITQDEIRQGGGVVLDRLEIECKKALANLTDSEPHHDIAQLLLDCSNAAKVQFAVVRAIKWGWLTAGKDWTVDLGGVRRSAVTAVLDVLMLLAGLDVLYGGTSVPERCTVHRDGLLVSWEISDDGRWQETVPPEHPDQKGERIRIVVEPSTSPYHRLDPDSLPDMVMRPVVLPVDLATDSSHHALRRRPINPPTYEQARPALTAFLHTVFRKREFRPMQDKAVFNTLRQQDTVVLLPTGAGKSIIYQLAGLLMPGVTIVVDPIVSLIEDQVEGMGAYGIDRAAPVAMNLAPSSERSHIRRRIKRGEYHFVLLAPERLQTPKFRQTLRALTEATSVNLAVIDEAHCVSEWGHDFRPAYLHLGDNLRLFCGDPPLLALTGTASRAVLRDVRTDLNIDLNRTDALIRPQSFDRPELSFEVVRTRPPDDPHDSLRDVMNSLPDKFDCLPLAKRVKFYEPSGRHTASGIVFVQTVNHRVYGLHSVLMTVSDATRVRVAAYSGDPPTWGHLFRHLGPLWKRKKHWDREKRKNARQFKDNQVTILVATKAFGMGIDKPNIRYTIHFGMPTSIEGFYQQAGRAGRDRNPARCIVVFSEFDERRSDALLDPDLELSALRDRYEEAKSNKQTSDDVVSGLYFHIERNFHGVEDEVKDVGDTLVAIGNLGLHRTVELPYSRGERTKTEKSLYRLLRIGVISDYELDFGAQNFKVTLDPFDFERCKKRLRKHLRTVQPTMQDTLVQDLNGLAPSNGRHGAFELACFYIRFIYDVIERVRRRMIQESILLVRRAHSGEDIRRRLLEYLQGGLDTEHITQLLEQPEIDLASWYELVETCQTHEDAGELRGLCIWALETDASHPGLLFCRAAAEAMCSDHDLDVSRQEFRRAIRGSIGKYGLPEEDVGRFIHNLLDLGRVRWRELGVSLVIALLELDDSGKRSLNGE